MPVKKTGEMRKKLRVKIAQCQGTQRGGMFKRRGIKSQIAKEKPGNEMSHWIYYLGGHWLPLRKKLEGVHEQKSQHSKQ